MKKYIDILGIKNLVVLLILSTLISCTGYTVINRIVDILLPSKTVEVMAEESENPGNEIWIVDSKGGYSLFSALLNGNKSGDWEYRDKDKFGYASDMLVSDGDNGAAITVAVTMKSEAKIVFLKNRNGGTVAVTADGKKQVINLFSSEEEGEAYTVCPFKNTVMPLMLHIAIYMVLIILCFCVLVVVCCRMAEGIAAIPFFFKGEVKERCFFLIWILLYIFAVIQYKIGIPNFIKYGDQVYYWSYSLLNNGRWRPAEVAEYLVSWRGYLCNLFPTLAHGIGHRLNIDPFYVYFLFPAAAIAWLITFVLPRLYEILTGKRAVYIQMLTSLVVFLFFWNGYLTAVLSDLYGVVAFMSGVLFAIRFWKNRRVGSALSTGLFWGAACNFRAAYQYGIIALIIVPTLVRLVRWLKKRIRETREKCADREVDRKAVGKVLVRAAAAGIIFLLISFPQFQINAAQGHTGILPYDHDEAWGTLDGKEKCSVIDFATNYALVGYISGAYVHATDEQLVTMKTQFYTGGEMLSKPQLLNLYASTPLESLICMGKRLFLAFDTKTSVEYPVDITWRGSRGLIFSILNYFVLGSAVYILLFSRKIRRNERVLFILFFVSLVLPQLFLHVEWRYFLSSYILLYLIFSYHFVGEMCLEPQECRRLYRTNYILYITALIYAVFLISLSIYA